MISIYYLFKIYFSILLPKLSDAINIKAPTTAPITKASRYISGLLTALAKTAKIPPCGALDTIPKVILRAPAIPLEMNNGGITRAGLLAANGIAPSVMNANPITSFTKAPLR